MNEFYAEHLVKKKNTKRDYLVRILFIGLTLYSCKLVKVHLSLAIVPFLLLAATVFIFWGLNTEYEYFYMNGYLQVDRIASKMRRKKVFEMRINELEVLVREGGFEVQPYRSVKVKDYTSRRKDQDRYEMVVSKNGKKIKVMIEPSELIVESMKKIAPKKVIV